MSLKDVVRTIMTKIADFLDIELYNRSIIESINQSDTPVIDSIHRIDESDSVYIMYFDTENDDLIDYITNELQFRYMEKFEREPEGLWIFAEKDKPIVEQMSKDEFRGKIKDWLKK